MSTEDVNYESNAFRCLTCVAPCPDPLAFESAVFNLTDSLGYVITEEYSYFNVIRGELKLKVTKPNRNKDGQLIAFKRMDTPVEGVYFAEGSLTFVQDVDFLRHTLNVALSSLGKIHAKRRVFEKDNIRINLDILENLGTYAEIDVGIGSSQPKPEDFDSIKDILNELGIKNSQLLQSSYLDLYRKMRANDSGLDDESNQSDY